jgi:cytochrome P450
MKEPGTFSIQQSFGGTRPLVEVMDELAAAGHDVVVDEDGMGALFLRAGDCERLLVGRGFSAVAMPILHLSGVHDGPLHDLWSVLMFGKDGADHRRIRNTIARFFTASGIERHRGFVEVLADGLARELPDGASFDLWDAFALPLAGRTACHIVGIPDADVAAATAWALDLVQAFGTMGPEARARAEQAAAEFCSYLDGLLAQKPSAAGGDIASELLSDADSPLSPEELRGLVANLVFGGLDAVAKTITTGVFHLLVHDQWSRLVGDPELALRAGDELLRFFPPTGATIRMATEPIQCAGVHIGPNQLVLPSLRAACRDPSLFDRPDELHLDRPAGKQFAFGAGPHYCLGMHLAKLVVGAGLSALIRRAPSLALARPAEEVPWGGSPFYGVEELLLRI